jgi:uncharacterized membrane protein (DUF106 family)
VRGTEKKKIMKNTYKLIIWILILIILIWSGILFIVPYGAYFLLTWFVGGAIWLKDYK